MLAHPAVGPGRGPHRGLTSPHDDPHRPAWDTPLRELRDVPPRAEVDIDAALEAVRPICADVQRRGEVALRELSERFDKVVPEHVRVPVERLEAALATLPADLRAALEEAIRRARLVHADQRRVDTTTTVAPGGTVTERWVPVERVGLYVPGGLAVYPQAW